MNTPNQNQARPSGQNAAGSAQQFTPEEIAAVCGWRTREILKARGEGGSIEELAQKFAVTPSRIRGLIRKGKREIETARRVQQMVAEGLVRIGEIPLRDIVSRRIWKLLEEGPGLRTVADVLQKTEADFIRSKTSGRSP